MNIVLCQISNKLVNPDAGKRKTLADEYYESFYFEKEKDGYYRPEHFWELPLWIGEATFALSDQHDVSLHIVENANSPLLQGGQVYCFSVLDANKSIIADIVRNNPDCDFVFGGYVDGKRPITDFGIAHYRTIWYDSIAEFCKDLGTPYRYGIDWRLFKGQRTIPRLTMSYGCTNKCSFCTVPDDVNAVPYQAIHQQMKALRDLEFKLVYLNDKTFGQCDNAEHLHQCYDYIKAFNPDFRGFIVQTTCAEVLRHGSNFWSDNYIQVVELGIETYNNELLTKYNKPQNERTIAKAVDKLCHVNINVIANVILGLPGETIGTYGKTLSFLTYFPFYAFNIYTLALYQDARIAKDIEKVNQTDSDELAETRSFWTSKEKRDYDHVSPLFYELGVDKVTL